MYLPSIILFSAGIFVIIMPYINNKIMLKKYSQVVKAKCIFHKSRIRHSVKVYCPVWEYSVNNVSYQSSEKDYTDIGLPKIDEEREIYVDPDYPDEIYRPNKSISITTVFGGLMFIGVGIYLIYLFNRR